MIFLDVGLASICTHALAAPLSFLLLTSVLPSNQGTCSMGAFDHELKRELPQAAGTRAASRESPPVEVRIEKSRCCSLNW